MSDKLTLQERVRLFNLGTPTPMHVGTHELVNDLWRANADMLAALEAFDLAYETEEPDLYATRLSLANRLMVAAIAAAVGDRAACAAEAASARRRPEAAQPPIHREGESQ